MICHTTNGGHKDTEGFSPMIKKKITENKIQISEQYSKVPKVGKLQTGHFLDDFCVLLSISFIQNN